MTKPLIGLTTTFIHREPHPPVYGTNQPYADAIVRAGGLPVLIPNTLSNDDLEVLVRMLAGVLFTGGYDIEPSAYGHAPHALIEKPDSERDRVEIHLAQLVIQHGIPFLGICRGIQVINVALGGSLYEDLSEQLPRNAHLENHDKPRDYLAHTVMIRSGSRLAEILPAGEIWVNSLHHQGVHEVAARLKVTATAPDDLVEAFELPEHPFGLAVQWHPEELPEHESMRKLFTVFVQACQVRASV